MKNILLTGISKGLGIEIAKILLKKDYHVYGISRSETPELLSLKAEFPEHFRNI